MHGVTNGFAERRVIVNDEDLSRGSKACAPLCASISPGCNSLNIDKSYAAVWPSTIGEARSAIEASLRKSERMKLHSFESRVRN